MGKFAARKACCCWPAPCCSPSSRSSVAAVRPRTHWPSADRNPTARRVREALDWALNLVAILAGLGLLVLGANWLVRGASEVARLLQVSELVVGLTVVAVGTSLPEIATSLVASLRGQRDIAVGNVVGSNIFNLLLVLGVCAAVAPVPIQVPDSALRFDIPIMFAVAVACWPIFFTGSVIDRWEGLAYLGFYAAYTGFLYLLSTHHQALDQYLTVMVYFVMPLTALILVVFVVRHWRNGSAAAKPPAAPPEEERS